MDTTAVRPWEVLAQNLPEHARNPIHTDAGAQAAGFPRALVAGVTTYAYLVHPLIAGWGEAWLSGGIAEVRFRRPVFDGDRVRCVPRPDGDAVVVEAVTDEPEQPRALVRAAIADPVAAARRDGEPVPDKQVALVGEWGSDYGERAGDDLRLCRELGVVHPAVWPALANHVVHTEVARGSWIHVRSIVRHHGPVPSGASALVRSTVVRRIASAAGERAVLDVEVVVDDRVVATLEHEAIVSLP
ncbi:MAG: MaoC family dehydratase [Acidimicrobiales bacterium]|nr:MaoC family dehydratase [Acidimicrobiales bacterium]MCB9394010.1 MaoC family dehydratase [Acidimicrobiaceae bacterium]